MQSRNRFWRRGFATIGFCTLIGASVALIPSPPRALAGSPLDWWRNRHPCSTSSCRSVEETIGQEVGGAWYWLHSPEQEKRVVMSLFNHFCIRCHGIDGRGVWDIPDVPDFTSPRWQSSRTDGELARSILEGRGTVMPPWRDTLSREQAWALARYVRTFVPGMEVSRPDFSATDKPAAAAPPPAQPK